MTYKFKTTTKSFAEVLGENLSTPILSHPISSQSRNNIKDIGATDTHSCAKNTHSCAKTMMVLVENRHFDAINYANRKQVSEISNQYILEDHKSRAGQIYQQAKYVTVTREILTPSQQIKTPYHKIASLFKQFKTRSRLFN